MSTSRHMDKICLAAVAAALIIVAVLLGTAGSGSAAAVRTMGYEERLFDPSRVHTVDIVMNDWEGFIENCENEEYAQCSVAIDGEKFANAAIRAKGNTSLSTVSSMNSDRYSFKIEFDHYDKTRTWHGLDKLSLNNLIQDATFMKDYLTYRMMGAFGAASPLCSFAFITVNGQDWGLYLAVESIEESFLERNYGSDYGELYKPDSLSFGGGRGNGRGFDMDDFLDGLENGEAEAQPENLGQPENFGLPDGSEWPGGFVMPDASGVPGNVMPSNGTSRSGQVPPTEAENFGNGQALPENAQGAETGRGDAADPPDAADPGTMPGGRAAIPGGRGAMMPGGNGFGGGRGRFTLPDGAGAENGGGFADRGGFGGGMGMGSADVRLQYIDDDPDSYANIFDNAKTDVTDADKNRLIRSLKLLSEGGESAAQAVDTDAVLRYFTVHNFVVNGDSYTGNMIHNYYLYEKDGRLSMLPWDYNLAFGSFQGNSAASAVNDPIDTPLSVTGSGDRPMIDWIFADADYTEQYHQYLADFLDTVDVTAMIDEAAELIAPYVEKDPTKFFTYEEFEAGTAALRQFCLLRAESVRGQLDGTIPSTSAGQSADGAALVDTSGLDLSAMGSMGGGMDRGMKDDMWQKGGFRQVPGMTPGQTETPDADAAPSSGKAAPADPAGEAVSEDPAGEAASEELLGKAAPADPAGEAVSEDPAGEAAAEELLGKAAPADPAGEAVSEDPAGEAASEDPSGEAAPENPAGMQPPGMGARPEEWGQFSAQTAGAGDAAFPIGLSALVMAAGLAAVFLYRKRA